MKILTDSQAAALDAFMECFDIHVSGAWIRIEEAMQDDFGIENPESAVEEAIRALRGEATE